MACEIIRKQIASVVEQLGLPGVDIKLEHPVEEVYGDYATNVAMVVARKLQKNPRELAEKIIRELKGIQELAKVVSKIKVAGPGFINFWLSQKYLVDKMMHIIDKGESFALSDYFKDKKIMLEYTDPNPFKEFHIGHLYTNIVGESLARLCEVLGANVKRANYQGDVGMHVAKSVWGMQRKMRNEKLTIKDIESLSLNEKVKFLGQAYALGANAYKDDSRAQEEIKDVNYLVYVAAQEFLQEKYNWKPQVDYKKYVSGKAMKLDQVRRLYRKGRVWSLAYFETIYKRLGTKFDYYYFESKAGEYGLKIVKEYLKKGIFEESEKAIVFNGKQYGLHTRVFVNSFGLPTYEAKDLGLAFVKQQDFPYDLSIIVTGNEINEYFQVVLKALEKIDPALRLKIHHIGHGMVRLPEGKMSSRTGKVLTGEWLLDETKKRAIKIIKQADRVKLKQLNKERVSEVVGIGAVKYALLKTNIGRDLIFDFRETLSFEGNSGPYLQYTYARCKSVIRKSYNPQPTTHNYTLTLKTLNLNDKEKTLLRTIYKFPEVVLEAGKSYSPNLICSFLFDLAQKYNAFYNKHRIIGSKNENLRLSLTAATAQVLKSGLGLLGIKTLERI